MLQKISSVEGFPQKRSTYLSFDSLYSPLKTQNIILDALIGLLTFRGGAEVGGNGLRHGMASS